MSKSVIFLVAVAAVALAVLVICTFAPSNPLEVVDGCSMVGAAKGGAKAADNRLKNRYEELDASDFDSTVSLDTMLHAVSPGDLDNSKAVRITGYVRNVGVGGVESCNCRATDELHRDTHIELVLTPGSGAKGVVIAEVTPRTRVIARQRGEDWSTEALHSKLLGHRVMVEGWLYFDPDHVDSAFTTDPEDAEGRANWRGTNWEVHPITSIRVLE